MQKVILPLNFHQRPTESRLLSGVSFIRTNQFEHPPASGASY